ncbi:MAG: ankyrin repeat domain-containing protein, partial [Gammaproteobacteria bacterium]
MSIDFRTRKFNDAVASCIKSIYSAFHQNVESNIIQENLQSLLRALEEYYSFERNKDYNEVQAKLRAQEVVSAFIQQLVYYCTHNIPTIEDKILSLLRSEFGKDYLFFNSDRRQFFNEPSVIIIWTDPQEGSTALNAASRVGWTNTVSWLLSRLEDIYCSKTTADFQAFITHLDKDQFSPLNTASKEGHVEVVQALLQAGEEAFGGRKTSEFKAFLEQQNIYGFTPLNAASKACCEDAAHLLIANGADPAIPNKRGFTAHQNKP